MRKHDRRRESASAAAKLCRVVQWFARLRPERRSAGRRKIFLVPGRSSLGRTHLAPTGPVEDKKTDAGVLLFSMSAFQPLCLLSPEAPGSAVRNGFGVYRNRSRFWNEPSYRCLPRSVARSEGLANAMV